MGWHLNMSNTPPSLSVVLTPWLSGKGWMQFNLKLKEGLDVDKWDWERRKIKKKPNARQISNWKQTGRKTKVHRWIERQTYSIYQGHFQGRQWLLKKNVTLKKSVKVTCFYKVTLPALPLWLDMIGYYWIWSVMIRYDQLWLHMIGSGDKSIL